MSGDEASWNNILPWNNQCNDSFVNDKDEDDNNYNIINNNNNNNIKENNANDNNNNLCSPL